LLAGKKRFMVDRWTTGPASAATTARCAARETRGEAQRSPSATGTSGGWLGEGRTDSFEEQTGKEPSHRLRRDGQEQVGTPPRHPSTRTRRPRHIETCWGHKGGARREASTLTGTTDQWNTRSSTRVKLTQPSGPPGAVLRHWPRRRGVSSTTRRYSAGGAQPARRTTAAAKAGGHGVTGAGMDVRSTASGSTLVSPSIDAPFPRQGHNRGRTSDQDCLPGAFGRAPRTWRSPTSWVFLARTILLPGPARSCR